MNWWRQVLTHVGTMGATFGLGALVVGPCVAGVGLGLVTGHEYGHYLAGWGVGARPSLPVFVPFGIGVWGSTTVVATDAQTAVIALAGPAAGSSCACVAMLVAIMMGWTWLTIVAAVALGAEVWNLTLGSDGKLWKQFCL